MLSNPRVAAGALAAALGLTFVVAAAPLRKVQFSDTKLKNGLRVIISEDHAAPVFAIVVNYNVGSRNERKGRTGFAHLFEHMMFKGSQNVGQNEHPYLMFMNGGNMNGTTNKDRTMYYEVLPANQLDLALFAEADRMRSLEITKDNLDNQRNAVQEERRLGVDNQPYGKTFEALDELAYENFAYEHSVIGSMADLSAASVEDVSTFFKTYYAPNNAVVSIVGDVDTKTALENPQQVLGYYLDNWTYGLPADYWDTYPARVSAVTAAQAQAAAKKYWDPSRLQIVAVGDATKVADVLRKKGELEVFDADGKPIK
jgi:predicted Zn-dependent peptidase